jgi:hypothetical protein|nr:hypothetical protein [Kofleriaceae bacterium]
MKIGDLEIGDDVIAHPLLGRAVVIERDGVPLTAMSVVDWERPREIPVVAAPAKLPAGAGARVINAIAERAASAGVAALRYAGPYPTPALYRALLRSFRASAGEDVFCANVMARAATLARDEVAVDFAPAPHRRVDHAHGWSELRDGVERVSVAGNSFDAGTGVARIVGGRCEIWFGDRCYAHVATVDGAGAIVDGPHAIPACTSQVVGKSFPVPLRAGIAELVADLVAAPLGADAHRLLVSRPLTWADLGARVAAARDDTFSVHAALWDAIAPLGMPRLAAAIAEALAPVVAATVIAGATESTG